MRSLVSWNITYNSVAGPLLTGGSIRLTQIVEPYVRFWGVETSCRLVRVPTRNGTISLTYGRGACSVCNRFAELKAVGIVSARFSNSPITRDQGGVFAGTYRVSARQGVRHDVRHHTRRSVLGRLQALQIKCRHGGRNRSRLPLP